MRPTIALLASLLAAAAGAALAQPAPSAETTKVAITAEPHHHLALENADVRVFRVQVDPQTATGLHEHVHDYFFVNLGAAEIENDVAGKAPATLKFQDGEVRFTAGGFSHIAKDLGSTPFRNVTVELLRPAKSEGAPAQGEAPTTRDLPGGAGTITILMTRDGVRASDIRLKAGGTIPEHHHAGGHLVVAVTDLDLHTVTKGAAATDRHIPAGEVGWVPAGTTHTVTNSGQGEARMITFDFPANAGG